MSSRVLEFMTYAEYLETPGWQETRKAAIEREGGRCALCGSDNKPLQVHHNDYTRLGEELPEDLTVLCSDCHEAYELGRSILEGKNGQK